MDKIWSALLAGALVATVAGKAHAELRPDSSAAAWKKPNWSLVENVSYLSGQDTAKAVLALPEGKGPFPALILIHEWWGLNDWVKGNALKFAEAGYAVLAIDLYRGRVAAEPELAHELMRGLPPDRASRDLRAAMDYLLGRAEVKKDRIGALGWCMGGGYALSAALELPELAACVINYGHLMSEPESIAEIHCPILGIFGAEDQGIPAEQVKGFAAACQQAGKQVQVQIYPGVGHAFLRSAPDSEAAKDAWVRTWDFLAANLKK